MAGNTIADVQAALINENPQMAADLEAERARRAQQADERWGRFQDFHRAVFALAHDPAMTLQPSAEQVETYIADARSQERRI